MGEGMTISIVLQFLIVLAAIWMGARSSGVGLGLWGAVGLLVLVVGFGVNPTSPPIDGHADHPGGHHGGDHARADAARGGARDPAQFLIAVFPSVNGYFFIPTYGSLIAAINFDLSRNDEDRQVRAEPLVHDPGSRRDLRRGPNGPRAREGDVLGESLKTCDRQAVTPASLDATGTQDAARSADPVEGRRHRVRRGRSLAGELMPELERWSRCPSHVSGPLYLTTASSLPQS